MNRKPMIVRVLTLAGIAGLALAGWLVRPEIGLLIAGVGLLLVTLGRATGNAAPQQADAAEFGNTTDILRFIGSKRKSRRTHLIKGREARRRTGEDRRS